MTGSIILEELDGKC